MHKCAKTDFRRDNIDCRVIAAYKTTLGLQFLLRYSTAIALESKMPGTANHDTLLHAFFRNGLDYF